MADPSRGRALASAWRAFWMSRLLVWSAGVLAVLASGASAYRELSPNAPDPSDTLSGLLLSPARRWDSGWFLAIAQGGYDSPEPRTAFFPLYPLLVRIVGEPIDALGFAGAYPFELAGVLIAMVALVVALYLLHRLTDLELGPEAADNAVLLLALFPTAFFFSAIYSESLFLALTLGCVYAARRGWWWRAALVGALASATRVQGVLVLVPLVMMLPHFRPTLRQAAALLLVPVGLVAFMVYLRAATRYGFTAPFKAHQSEWLREFKGPLAGIWGGADEAADSVGDVLAGRRLNEPVSSVRSGIVNFAALVFATLGVAGALRRLPLAYGAYALVGLIVAISFPVPDETLKSLPRLVLVLFPIFMWAGLALTRWGHRTVVLAVSAVGLAWFSAAFATGYWIA